MKLTIVNDSGGPIHFRWYGGKRDEITLQLVPTGTFAASAVRLDNKDRIELIGRTKPALYIVPLPTAKETE